LQETTKLKANGVGTMTGRLFLGTAEKIPPEELVDTTGAGDAFIGAVLYGKQFAKILVHAMRNQNPKPKTDLSLLVFLDL